MILFTITTARDCIQPWAIKRPLAMKNLKSKCPVGVDQNNTCDAIEQDSAHEAAFAAALASLAIEKGAEAIVGAVSGAIEKAAKEDRETLTFKGQSADFLFFKEPKAESPRLKRCIAVVIAPRLKGPDVKWESFGESDKDKVFGMPVNLTVTIAETPNPTQWLQTLAKYVDANKEKAVEAIVNNVDPAKRAEAKSKNFDDKLQKEADSVAACVELDNSLGAVAKAKGDVNSAPDAAKNLRINIL